MSEEVDVISFDNFDFDFDNDVLQPRFLTRYSVLFHKRQQEKKERDDFVCQFTVHPFFR